MRSTRQVQLLRTLAFTAVLFVERKMSPLTGIHSHPKTTINIPLARVQFAGS